MRPGQVGQREVRTFMQGLESQPEFAVKSEMVENDCGLLSQAWMAPGKFSQLHRSQHPSLRWDGLPVSFQGVCSI